MKKKNTLTASFQAADRGLLHPACQHEVHLILLPTDVKQPGLETEISAFHDTLRRCVLSIEVLCCARQRWEKFALKAFRQAAAGQLSA